MTDIDTLAALVRTIRQGMWEDARIALATVDSLALIKSKRGGPPLPRWSRAANDHVIVDTANRLVARDIFPAEAEHAIRHDPARVLREGDAKERLVNLLLAEKHHVAEDQYYTCLAATQERDGGVYGDGDESGPCDCGRDERVAAYLGLLAEAYEEGPK